MNDMNDNLQALEKWAQQIAGIVESATPKVWSTAVSVERAGSLGLVIIRGAVALMALVAVLVCGSSAMHQARGLVAQVCTKHAFAVQPMIWDEGHQVRATSYTEQVCENRVDTPDGPVLVAATILWAIGGIIAFLVFMGAATDLCDPWVWIGGFRPELSVAKDIMDKVLDT